MYRQNKHDVLSYLDLGIYMKAGEQGTMPDIALSDRDMKFAKRKCSRKTVVIAPGGGANTGQNARIKLWPKERYAALIDRLPKKYGVILRP